MCGRQGPHLLLLLLRCGPCILPRGTWCVALLPAGAQLPLSRRRGIRVCHSPVRCCTGGGISGIHVIRAGQVNQGLRLRLWPGVMPSHGMMTMSMRPRQLRCVLRRVKAACLCSHSSTVGLATRAAQDVG